MEEISYEISEYPLNDTNSVPDIPTDINAVPDTPTDTIAVPDTPTDTNSVSDTPTDTIGVPSIVFIVPYRDRKQHLQWYREKMTPILEKMNKSTYKTIIVHQKDTRSFNRGAIKNIGFLIVKRMYPNDYQNMTLVFNDVDTVPVEPGIIDYPTTRGKIKHFYGFKFTLGGIFSITGADFERINGFPNYWSWGFEDNLIQTRAERAGIQIDRSVFYEANITENNTKIIQYGHSPLRVFNNDDYRRFTKRENHGINVIHGIIYEYNEKEDMYDVTQFFTSYEENKKHNLTHDLRNGMHPVGLNGRTPGITMNFFKPNFKNGAIYR